ncbi:winged helix-turn-helix transcriptional regulator [Catenuloplanes indicus]|uniref:DNA-binding HxlR family transcriptional regulator n=1 Tax=Catenuloplanes indicus TaxID=137267 RepID=A0AAE3VWH2_9ACTN|nr:helix-turn-helix domain-containing protein [Catenuloplanes indicus]MDQ0365503.1 DNA-binding HxlR family transcriptional regulator [Catenuloplanes indicus]
MYPLGTPVSAAARDSCAATDVLRRTGDKWSLLVLGLLAARSYGYNELDRAIDGLSRRILTRTLRGLVRDGLVRRHPVNERTGRVEYALTGLGRSLLPLVVAVGEWAERHAAEIDAARREFAAGP